MTEIHPGIRHNGNFRKLWAGQSVSLVGSAVTYLALPLLAIYTINAGAFEVGLIGFAQEVPFLLVTLWAGAWIDRRRRIPVMLVVDFTRAGLLVLLVVLALAHLLTLESIMAIVFVFGIGSVLFDVSYFSVLPSIVNRSDLMTANSRLQYSESIATVTGPNIGGFLIQAISAPFALLVDAFSFLISAANLMRIRTVETVERRIGPEQSQWQQIKAGLAYVARNPMLRTLTAGSALYNFFANWTMTLFPVLAVRVLGLNAGSIGLVLSSGAIGSLFGALVAAPLIRRLGAGHSYLLAKSITWIGVFSLTLAPAHRSYTLLMLLAVFWTTGMMIVANVVGITLRQAVTPYAMLGRMNATYKFVSFGAQALGPFAGGLVGAAFGVRFGIVAGAIGLLSSVLVGFAPAVRRIRELPASLPAEPATVDDTIART
ncbi:MAG: MFS transporter, partial [Micromonosporaceae bacterium]